MPHPAPTRADLVEAVEAISTFYVSRDGKIRTRKRGPAVGYVELESDSWQAFVAAIPGRAHGHCVVGWHGSEGKRDAVETVLLRRAADIRQDFLIDLILRHPSRLNDIRYATTVPYRDDPAALGGLATDKDIDAAIEAIRAGDRARCDEYNMQVYAAWIAYHTERKAQ